ncbi:acetate kinase [Verruconis gallopava]|uniref:Probable acetate kinase n=1 Tax=Verruconis gallopava TaxID=253628 RepID=A0A0D2A747_9PEZI|nr:acetate kinase [Verruconis gallopava]KIW02395.1 acetate kinase [Verruconis gallopava]
MVRVILSVNAGSSSVKVSVYKDVGKGKDPEELAVVQVDGLTAPPPTLKYSRGNRSIKGQELQGIESQEDGFRYIMQHLEEDEGLPELSNRDDISFVTHRVVHGGDYPRAQVITKETYHHIEILSDLAPLHNAGALTIVRAAHKELPKAVNIAYFDSAFHSTIPRHISTYPIDPKIAQKNRLRKYGFHGISYSFIVKAVAAFLQKPVEQTSIIALHLGSGASACAIKNGKSWDTSMGLTPLAGLPGATRSGSVDPSLVFHYTHDAGKLTSSGTKDLHITQAEQILNKESGWKALTGTTDFGKISSGEDEECRLAFDLVANRILNFVGSYYVTLRGDVDALVFAGGIGEKGSKLRSRVVEGAACLGFGIDEGKNSEEIKGVVSDITGGSAKHKVLVCQTDEQLEMARGCVEDAEEFEKQAKDG